MCNGAKIMRQQKAFLKAMKEKFAIDTVATSQLQDPVPVTYKVIDCPICRGKGYHGPKRAFCHTCGSTGKKRVRA